MKKFLTLAVAIIAILVMATPALSQTETDMGFLSHRHQVTLTVQAMEEALSQMAHLPGTERSSNINLTQGRGNAQRVLPTLQLPQALAMLETMGNITASESSTTNLFRDWSNISTEIMVRQREYHRLIALLYEAETINQFRTIERQLVQVIGNLELLRGQLLHVEQQMGSTELFITFNLYHPTPDGTTRNPILASFFNSLTFMQNVLVVGAYASLPFGLFVVFALTAYLVAKKIVKKLNTKEVPTL